MNRIASLAMRDKGVLAGLAFTLLLGIIANGALHAGNFDMAAKGSGSGAVGLATAAQASGIVMAAPLLVLLTRAVRRVNLALVAGGLTAVGFLSIFAGSSVAAVVPGRFLLGCGIGLGMAFSEYVIISRARPGLRPLFVTAFGVVLAGGHALGTLLMGFNQFSPVLLILPVLLVVGSVLLSKWGQLPPQQGEERPRDLWRLITISPAIFLAAALFGFLDNGFLTMLPDFFARAGIEREGLVIASFAAFAGICAFQIPAGLLAARFEPFGLLRGIILLLIGGIMLTAFAVDVAAIRIPMVFVLGGMLDILYTVGLISLAATVPRQHMAAANACFVSFCGLGEVGGPLVTGPTLQFGGFDGGIIMILYLLVAYWIGSALLQFHKQTQAVSLPL